jgi:hypothetical protein
VGHGDNPADEMRLEWRKYLDWLEALAGKAMNWAEEEYEELSSKPQALRRS